MYDIASGFYYLHQYIVHGDFKSLNVLLSNDLRAKISDFGTSYLKGVSSTTVSMKQKYSGQQATGTLLWMAPELFEDGAVNTRASDIYSLGMVFWEILVRKVPFEGVKQELLYFKIKEREGEKIPEEYVSEYPTLCALIQKCFQRNPTKRPKIAEVMKYMEQIKEEFGIVE